MSSSNRIRSGCVQRERRRKMQVGIRFRRIGIFKIYVGRVRISAESAFDLYEHLNGDKEWTGEDEKRFVKQFLVGS